MLRRRIRALVEEEKYRPHLNLLFKVTMTIGILWIISFPYFARGVFTSENAFRPGAAVPTFGVDDEGTVFSIFTNIKARVTSTFKNPHFGNSKIGSNAKHI